MKTYSYERLPNVIDLKLNEVATIDFPFTAGTGYRWDWDLLPDNIAVDNEKTKPFSDAAGAGARVYLTIRAISKGAGKIKLKYWQPWSGEDSVEQRTEIEFKVE